MNLFVFCVYRCLEIYNCESHTCPNFVIKLSLDKTQKEFDNRNLNLGFLNLPATVSYFLTSMLHFVLSATFSSRFLWIWLQIFCWTWFTFFIMAKLSLQRWIVLLYKNQTSMYLKDMESYTEKRVLAQSLSSAFLRVNIKIILYEKGVCYSGYTLKIEVL